MKISVRSSVISGYIAFASHDASMWGNGPTQESAEENIRKKYPVLIDAPVEYELEPVVGSPAPPSVIDGVHDFEMSLPQE
jgi:hypothetical protein